jgi:hypothetical protein
MNVSASLYVASLTWSEQPSQLIGIFTTEEKAFQALAIESWNNGDLYAINESEKSDFIQKIKNIRTREELSALYADIYPDYRSLNSYFHVSYEVEHFDVVDEEITLQEDINDRYLH